VSGDRGHGSGYWREQKHKKLKGIELPMVQTPIKQLTLLSFWPYRKRNRPVSINGQVSQKSMPQGQHSRIQQKLLDAINAVAFDALRANSAYAIGPRTVRKIGY